MLNVLLALGLLKRIFARVVNLKFRVVKFTVQKSLQKINIK